MRSLLSLVVVLCGASCVGGNAAAGALLRPMRIPVIGSPSLAHEDFTVTTPDGVVLKGWLFTPKKAPRGVLVLVHGKDINRQHFVDAAERFVAQGLAVVAYDQRAHGASTGQYVTYGAREVGDLRLVIDRALSAWGRELPVVLVGESLGAAVALQTTAVEPRVRAVVAGAAFADLATVIEDHAPGFMGVKDVEEATLVAEREAGFLVADISPERAARSITVPALLLHGSEDRFLPLKHSLRILAALAGPKRLVRLEGVDHIGILLSRQAWDEIDRFIAASLATSSPAAR